MDVNDVQNLNIKVCPRCGSKNLVFVEYDYTCPERYDGISEIQCTECDLRIGRWTGKYLAEGELEPRLGRKDKNENNNISS